MIIIDRTVSDWERLCIDSDVLPYSRYTVLIYASVYLILLLLAAQQPLAWWQGLLLLAVMGVTAIAIYWRLPKLVHITQPSPASHQDMWQLWLYDAHARRSVEQSQPLQQRSTEGSIKSGVRASLYQGRLLHAHDRGKLVLLEFAVIEPIPRRLRLCIWQDQVDYDAWHRLKIRARA